MADLENSWFKLLWECNDILEDFHYFPEKPSLSKEDDSLLEKFHGIIEGFIFDSSSDRTERIILELGKFSKTHFSDYLAKYKEMKPVDTEGYNCQWTICQIFLGQLKFLKKDHNDLVKSLCIKSFDSDEILDQFRLFTNRAPVTSSHLSNDTTYNEYREKVKTLKLLRKVFKKYQESPEKEKEYILKNGLEVCSELKNLKRLEKVIPKIQREIPSPVILIEKDGDYKSVYTYENKLQTQQQKKIIKKTLNENSKIEQASETEVTKDQEQTALGKSTLFSILVHIVLITCLTLFFIGTTWNEEPKEIKLIFVDQKEKLERELPIEPMEIEEPSLLEPQTVLETLPSDAKSLIEAEETYAETLDIDPPEYIADSTVDLDFSHLTISHQPLGFKGSLLGKRRGLQVKEALVKEFGGSKEGQDALLKGLRWLQKEQSPNGSWGFTDFLSVERKPIIVSSDSEAHTALAVLAFLAYGVTEEHQEFGSTISKALKWMLNREKKLRSREQLSGCGYEHPIFTFAICEAVALMPDSKELRGSMERLLETLLYGQAKDGGFNYQYRERSNGVLTLTGWNYLAIKAAITAASKNPKLSTAPDKVIKFLDSKHVPNEGFRYIGGLTLTHRAIGCLGIQLMGYAKASNAYTDVMKVVKHRDIVEPNPERKREGLYGYYYLNQVLFNEGGEAWDKWVKLFEPYLIKSQNQNGSWSSTKPNISIGGDVLQTCLACLMLTVYYRYEPTHEINPHDTEEDLFEEEGLDLFEEEGLDLFEEEGLDLFEEEGLDFIRGRRLGFI